MTSVGAPDADILLEAIEELRKRTTAGAATFLVNVKAHGGEPAKETNIQADKAISGKDVPTKWHDRTNRAVFTWQEPRQKGGRAAGCGRQLDEDQQKRRCAKHRDRVTGAWKQIRKQRRQVDVSYDPSMVTALQHGT